MYNIHAIYLGHINTQLCVCIEAFLFNFTNTNFMMNIIFTVIGISENKARKISNQNMFT